MSFDPLSKALEENPALAEELRKAKSPRERHAILDAHGIEKPNLDSQFPEVGRRHVIGGWVASPGVRYRASDGATEWSTN
jgi:hypothetical protein